MMNLLSPFHSIALDTRVICPLGSDDCLDEECVGATCSALPQCAQVPDMPSYAVEAQF